MPTQKILLLVGAIVVLAALVLGVVYLNPTEDVTVDYSLTTVADGTYTGELPSLDREIQFLATTDEAVRTALRTKVAEDQARLKRVPYDGNAWMDLALRYHSAGDYEGAREVWEFIVSVPPVNVTALGNLGRLHHFELKQYEKAEQYFFAAVEANPARPEAYYELFDLYRYSYKKDTTAAVDILKKASEFFPDDPGIPAGIAIFYRDTGRPALARTYFEKAVVLARASGNLELVQSFNSELSNLP